MNLSDVEDFLRRHRTASVLAGFLLVFAGVDLLLNPNHLEYSEVLGIPFFTAGLALFALLFRRMPRAGVPHARRTLAPRFLDPFTLHRRLLRWFPPVPIALTALALPHNPAVSR